MFFSVKLFAIKSTYGGEFGWFFRYFDSTDLPTRWPFACVWYAAKFPRWFFFSLFILIAFELSGTESEFELDWISLQRSIRHRIPLVQRILVFPFSIPFWPSHTSFFGAAHTCRPQSLCHFSFPIVHWFIRKLVSLSSESKSHWNCGFSSGRRVAATAATDASTFG